MNPMTELKEFIRDNRKIKFKELSAMKKTEKFIIRYYGEDVYRIYDLKGEFLREVYVDKGIEHTKKKTGMSAEQRAEKQKEYTKAYRERNRADSLEYQKKYYQDNKELIKKRNRELAQQRRLEKEKATS